MENKYDLIEQKFQKAQKGQERWNEIKKTHNNIGINYACIFYLLDGSDYINDIEEWIPEFVKRKGFDAVVLFILEHVKISIKQWPKEVKLISIQTTAEEIKNILAYYGLYRFTNYAYVISFEQPYGNRNMIGHKGVQFKDWLRNWG